MPQKISPPFLKPGDTVGIIAPASAVSYEDLVPGIAILKELGLKVLEGKTLRSSFNQFAATDEERLADFQHMLDNPQVNAIIAARGGYGCSRIIDQLDFSEFVKNPKWIVGFSDLTVILSRTQLLGYQSIHAPMIKSMMLYGADVARQTLINLLFGELPAYEIEGNEMNRSGIASGEVTGGNLCLLAHLTGSDTQVNTSGKILFIEDVNEYLYNLDRMMLQLKRSGQLSSLAGLIVGQFSDVKDNAAPVFGKSIYEIIEEHVSAYDYPVCYNFPVGHVDDNRPMLTGAYAELEVSKNKVSLKFSPNIS